MIDLTKDEIYDKKIMVRSGGIWECNSFIIYKNYIQKIEDGYQPCEHCSESFEVIGFSFKKENGYREVVKAVKIPNLIVASNEGGYSNTGVCGDCIREALEENKK